MPTTDMIELDGLVTKALPGDSFLVEVETGKTRAVVTCKIAGKLRQHRIRILVGDRVTIEMSPYDLSKGRITWRDRG